MNESRRVEIGYYSDVLCIWAYVAQIKLDQIRQHFGAQALIQCHYLTIFGDTETKIVSGWQARGGFDAYNRHVRSIAETYDYVAVHPRIWLDCRPPSSLGCHLFLKAVELLQATGVIPAESQAQWRHRTTVEEAAWRLRLAFFRDCENVAEFDLQLAIAAQLGIPAPELRQEIESGRAYSALSADLELKDKMRIEGSPTLVLNQGRQKLYGNLGYNVIEANIHELLEQPGDRASWC